MTTKSKLLKKWGEVLKDADGPKRQVDYDTTNGGTILFKAIGTRQWKYVFSRIQHAPHECSTFVYRVDCSLGVCFTLKSLPLHAACMRQPPPVVLSALIAAYPKSASIKCHESLPLHIALKHGASLEAIQILILAYPEALKEVDSEGNAPIDVIQKNPDAWKDDMLKEKALKILESGVDGVDIDNMVGGGESTSKEIVGKKVEVQETTGREDLRTTLNEEGWKQAGLIVTVIGASGDLAKKKTYPSLLHLFDDNLLPEDTIIWGYARSNMTHEDLRSKLRPFLEKSGSYSASVIDSFLSKCFYQHGKGYGDLEAFQKLANTMHEHEEMLSHKLAHNRLFYFAIPPNVFAETGVAIKKIAMADKGWSRIIVEKPFGRDLESCEEILAILAEQFDESNLFRIDHYLGKEMVQNLLVLRFGNLWFERIWDRNNVQCVILTFKEPFGTEGRGGYFDKYGIIRDIIQNHLMQVLTLLAMEPPTKADGPESGESIRDMKVQVLKAIPPVTLEECVLGQYEGYTDDPTIDNKDSNTPTYAAIRCFVHTPRWAGVPFIFKAGKALDERKAEMRIQFKDAPAAEFLFDDKCPRNELVIRLQPDEAIYFKTNVKAPGFHSEPIQSELEVNYSTRFFDHSSESNPDAYTRLILDVLRGRSAAFVREDELRRSWEIFTPLLHRIERENIRPVIYKRGSRGPKEADDFIASKSGYIRNEDYVFFDGDVVRKSETTSQPYADIGVYGLAVMGQNFALNIASHGFKVCVGNRSTSKVDLTVKRAKVEGNLPLIGSSDPESFVKSLKRPRKIILLVQAGKPVDATIAALSKHLEPGDIIVDGGNEWYLNSIRRSKELEGKGILFVGMGISGGEEGARNGPSLMPGGPKEAYKELEHILTSCAAQVSDGACTGYIGPIGSGNYVKMVHNGIEYGDMQLIAEAYDIMKNILGMDNEEMAKVFSEWNKGELESYLIEITATILAKQDDITSKGHVVDYVLDKTGSKGTGKWTTQEAAEQSVAAPTISGSLDARYLSGRKNERVVASKVLNGPSTTPFLFKEQVLQDLGKALYAAKICSYAQGLGIINSASHANNWDINLNDCARMWKGGCIIRAKLLNKIQAAVVSNPDLPNLLLDPMIARELGDSIDSWRRIIISCAQHGIPCPSLGGSLTYYDSYRTVDSPANLTQAMRDFFGGHTYERIDVAGPHHCAWTGTHKDIGNINERTKGEK